MDAESYSLGENYDNKKLQNAMQLLQDIKGGFMREMNIDIEKIHAGGLKVSGNTNSKVTAITGKRYSRNTKEKAERIRIYLELFYALVEKSITSRRGEQVHEGVEGVYNPLQVIRNRKLRKSHGDPTRAVKIVKHPLIAVLDFSRRNKPFPWFVDIYEASSDSTWRTTNWAELRRPDGGYWFKQDNARVEHLSPPKVHRRRRESSVRSESETNDSALEGEDSPVKSPEMTASSSFSSYSQNNGGPKRRGRRSFLSKLARAPIKSQKGPSDPQEIYAEDTIPLLEYKTPMDNGQRTGNIFRDVKISSFRDRAISDWTPSTSASLSPSPVSSPIPEEPNDPRSQIMCERLAYLACSWSLIIQRRAFLEEREARATFRSRQIKERCNQLRSTLPRKEVCLQQYDVTLGHDLEICRSWKERLVSEYAVRIDNLIFSSDRILSDANTTLMLRVKALQEDMAALGISNCVKQQAIPKLAFALLERLIVVAFWIVWLLFSIAQGARVLIATIFSVISYIF